MKQVYLATRQAVLDGIPFSWIGNPFPVVQHRRRREHLPWNFLKSLRWIPS